jgi:HlyD family secretion protein
MTANTNIITAERDSVLRIPLTALRYVPRGLSSDTTAHHRAHGAGQVWVLRQGQPQAVPVVTGLDDGTYAEVVKGALTADDQVVVNQVETSGGGGSASQANRPVFRF